MNPHDIHLQQAVFAQLARAQALPRIATKFADALQGNAGTTIMPLPRSRGRWRRRRRRITGSKTFANNILPLQLSYVPVEEPMGFDDEYTGNSPLERAITEGDNARLYFIENLITSELPANNIHMEGTGMVDDLPSYFYHFIQNLYKHIFAIIETQHGQDLRDWHTRLVMMQQRQEEDEELDEEIFPIPPLEELLSMIRALLDNLMLDVGPDLQDDMTTSMLDHVNALIAIFQPETYPERFQGEPDTGHYGVHAMYPRPQGYPALTLEMFCMQRSLHALLCGLAQIYHDWAHLIPENIEYDHSYDPCLVRNEGSGTECLNTALYPNYDFDFGPSVVPSARYHYYTGYDDSDSDDVDDEDENLPQSVLQFAIIFSNAIAIGATALTHLQQCHRIDEFMGADKEKWDLHETASKREHKIRERVKNHKDVREAASRAEERLEDLMYAIGDFDNRLRVGRVTTKAMNMVYRIAGYPQGSERTKAPSFSRLLSEKRDIENSLVDAELNMEVVEEQTEARKRERINITNQEIGESFNNLHPILLQIWVNTMIEIFLMRQRDEI
jgi:adenosyl cobinamide kinase/adenosyl cobinamide phosphate guanylyltransferase